MKAVIIGLALFVVCSPPGHTAEGRIPIFEPIVLDGATPDPETGEAPDINGRYIVTNDIEQAVDGESVIQIIGNGTEQIEIDLNGFTLTEKAGAMPAIAVDRIRSLVVRAGTVVSESTAEVAAPVVRVGFLGSVDPVNTQKVLIERVTVIGGQNVGVGLYGVDNFTVRDNSILGPRTIGIQVKGNNLLGNSQGRIERNLVRGQGSSNHGIETQGNISSVIIRENQIEGVGGNGIHAAPGLPGTTGLAVITDNAIENTGRRGIFVNHTSSCKVSGNVVRGAVGVDADGHGIHLISGATGCLVQGNSSGDNANHGILIEGSSNQIENNVLINNQGFGLVFRFANAANNSFGRNTSRGNGGIGESCPSPPPSCQNSLGLDSPDFCDKSGNSTNTSFGDNLAPGLAGPC